MHVTKNLVWIEDIRRMYDVRKVGEQRWCFLPCDLLTVQPNLHVHVRLSIKCIYRILMPGKTDQWRYSHHACFIDDWSRVISVIIETNVSIWTGLPSVDILHEGDSRFFTIVSVKTSKTSYCFHDVCRCVAGISSLRGILKLTIWYLKPHVRFSSRYICMATLAGPCADVSCHCFFRVTFFV